MVYLIPRLLPGSILITTQEFTIFLPLIFGWGMSISNGNLSTHYYSYIFIIDILFFSIIIILGVLIIKFNIIEKHILRKLGLLCGILLILSPFVAEICYRLYYLSRGSTTTIIDIGNYISSFLNASLIIFGALQLNKN